MKIFYFLLFLACISCKSKVPKKQFSSSLHLVGDSGYVLRKDAISLLLYLNRKVCYKDIDFNIQPSSDTIGKYYRKKNTKNHILCLQNYFKSVNGSEFFLLEMNNTKILKEETYSIGFYNCFSGKDNFIKMVNDYFSYSTYGTGSAFCGEEMYFFKEIISQDSMNSITTKVFRGGMKDTKSILIESKLDITDSKISAKYFKSEADSENEEQVFKLQETFSINYYWKKNKWMCFDSLNLEKIAF